MYILDSDSISLLFRFPGQQPHLERRLLSTPHEHIFISVISVEEAIMGAFKLRDNRGNPSACYKLLAKIVPFYGKYQILPYDEGPMRRFAQFSAAIRRDAGGKGDRQIAATALHYHYAVITRNRPDFEPTGCLCDDWTQPPV